MAVVFEAPAIRHEGMKVETGDSSTNDTQEKSGAATLSKKRNAAATRERILASATKEFCTKGYDGARMERIVRGAGCNIRMIYHYFGGKENLYLAVLERIYAEVRGREAALNLADMGPEEGMRALVQFTFDHLLEHPEFVSLIGNENLMKGRFLKKSKQVPLATMPLVENIRKLLKSGQKAGIFRKKVDPIQLYVSILALSFVHVSNRYTLSIMFRQDLQDPKWLAIRRAHACDMILQYLKS